MEMVPTSSADTDEGRAFFGAEWSPDGKRLAYYYLA